MRASRRAGTAGLVAALAVLAVLAYVPALVSSPGRMPADTKLYLYLDPGRLIGDAPWTFDGRQFAGWVPHQVIAYLWPQGPWYWLGDAVGLPDWVVHRLWIGTLFLAAGTGVLWLARRLGLGLAAAFAAASRLPARAVHPPLRLADLGDAAAVGRPRLDRRAHRAGGDAHPLAPRRALRALVVATVGAVNATALLMVAPAPVLWLVDRGSRRHDHLAAGRGDGGAHRRAVARRVAVVDRGASSSRAASAPTCSPTASRWSR